MPAWLQAFERPQPALTMRTLALLIASAVALVPTRPPRESPPAPWRFRDARVLYQPTFVRASAAQRETPSGLTLLSLFGWTLGGVFVVEWTSSPVGYYREVAVLSGLVARGLSVGAWASHIVVTTDEAAEGGRDVFGLPTTVGAVEFFENAEDDGGLAAAAAASARALAEALALAVKVGLGAASPGVAEPSERLRPPAAPRSTRGFDFGSDAAVDVVGWDGWCASPDEPEASGPGLALPSFSGRLAGASPLLKYPLRLGPAARVGLRPAMPTRWSGAVSRDLVGVLDGPRACPCLQVDGVVVVAGRPEVAAA